MLKKLLSFIAAMSKPTKEKELSKIKVVFIQLSKFISSFGDLY